MATLSTIIFTFLFCGLLIGIIIIMILHDIKQSEISSIKMQIVGVQENYSKLLNNINSYLSKSFVLNDEYHKSELIGILQLVDNKLLSIEKYTQPNLYLLQQNRDIVAKKFLDWTMINKMSDTIIGEKGCSSITRDKFLTAFNNACSKYCHLKTKYKSAVVNDNLEFVTDRSFYEKNYFSKLEYLLNLSYQSLSEGNFIKAFKLKNIYDELFTETTSVLRIPADFQQKIHDALYEAAVLEGELSNHIKGKRYHKILMKLDSKVVKNETFELFNKLRTDRNKYLSTIKWSDDAISKYNYLKKIKMMMINVDNAIDIDIRESKESSDKNSKTSLSRAANIIEAESKFNKNEKDIWDDIFSF